MIFIFLSLVFLFLSAAEAGENSAEVLPPKVYRLQFTGVVTGNVADEFNSQGNIQSLAKSLNRTVTADDFAQSEPRLQSLVNALNSLSPNLGDQLLSANLFSDVNVRQKRFLGVLSYGLTKKLTASVVVPTIQRNVTAELSAEAVNNAEAIKQAVGNLSPDMSDGLDELAAQNMNGEFFKEQIFRSKGYVFNDKYSATDLGDVELRLRYRHYRSRAQTHAVDFSATLPTGKTAPIDNVFDPGSGNGKLTLGVSSQNQFYFDRRSRDMSIAFRNGISYSLMEKRLRAVPLDADDTLPSLLPEDGQVQETTEASKPKFQSTVTFATQFLQKSWIFEATLDFETQGASKFSGPGGLFYEGFDADSGGQKLEAELSVGYSSVNSFLHRQSKIPFEFVVHYNRVLSGRNTPISDYVRTDLVLFLK